MILVGDQGFRCAPPLANDCRTAGAKAIRNDPRPLRVGFANSLHSTSKMASISTAMFPGSEFVPIALRAPTPSSPNTSFINSE